MIKISYDETKVDGEKFLSVLSADENLIKNVVKNCQQRYGKGITIQGFERQDGQVCLFYIEPLETYISGKYVDCYTAFISDGVNSFHFGLHFSSPEVLLEYAKALQGKTKEDYERLSNTLVKIEAKSRLPIDRLYEAEQTQDQTSQEITL